MANTSGADGGTRAAGLYELYQAEWCPYSSRVREELTERGVDFVARQVPAQKPERAALRQRTGSDGIPALVVGETVLTDFDQIMAFLAEHHPRRPDAAVHRGRDVDPEEQQARLDLLTEYP